MKILAAFTLIVISMASAEPPRYRPVLARQSQDPTPASAPYNPSGWKPSGPAFNYPIKSADQQSPEPKPSYGPPPEPQPSYGPPESTETPTTTEAEGAAEPTENTQAEKIKVDSETGEVKSAAVKTENAQPGAYFVLLPRVEVKSENLVVPVTSVAEEKAAFLTPLPQVQTQNYVVPVVEVTQQNAALVTPVSAPLQIQRIVPLNSAYRNEIYTPFSSSIVQVYQ